MALTDKLTAIAHAIRAKTGKTEALTLDEMAIEIANISSGGETERSLKKLLDATKSTSSLFYKFSGSSATEYMLYEDTSKVTDMSYMFGNCRNLTTVPLFDTSEVTNMSSMFNGCTNLTTVPLFDTSNATSMSYMFNECTKLTTVPLFDTSNATSMSYMFNECTKLTTVPLFDTSKVTDMSSMFKGCRNLTTVSLLDTSKATRMSYMFDNCKNLTDCYIRNIKVNLTVGSGTSYGHLLTVESLVYLSNELVNVNSSRVLTIGSANLEKITSVYVKLIDITDEMRAEDGLIDSKLPCVVCENTDEGAMLLSEYTLLKKWTLK